MSQEQNANAVEPAAEPAAAYVLPEGALPSTEAHQFVGFPGLWAPGVPQLVSTVGLTPAEAARLVAELGLPLEPVGAPARASSRRKPSRTGRS